MKKLLILLLFSLALLAGEIKIALAANVSYAIDDLKKAFNKIYPDIKVEVIIGSSGKLFAQIKHSAPYMIFMSANMDYPNALYRDKIAITKPKIYAKGVIALLSSKKREFKKGINLLISNSIKKIAIANPKTAPYGKATIEALKNAKIYDRVKNKFVFGESISQTLSYTIRVTDIGIVAKSALFNPKLKNFKEGSNWIEINPKLYTPINQGIVITKAGENNREVEAFYNFILSREAKEIFKKYGYLIKFRAIKK